MDCQCEACKSACKNNPGWFTYGEAEVLAEHMGITLEQLFQDHLIVDWWEADDDAEKDVFLLKPGLVGKPTGEESPGNPNGQCTFLKDGLCSIHAVKPWECKTWDHTIEDSRVHKEAMKSWNNEEAQQQIKDLLGRDPVASEYSGGSIFGLFGGW